MANSRRVAVVVGSLRKDSLNRKMAKALVGDRARAALQLEIVEIGQLPLYNQDDDAQPAGRVGRLQGRRSPRPTRCCSSPRNTTARCPAC